MSTHEYTMTNSNPEFWKACWQVNDIGFHKLEVHSMLAKHVNKLIGGKSSAKILFPFCGKSLDMNWLASQGHEIVGVEFVEDAVLQFFAEQNIKYEVKEVENFKLFTSADGKIKIYNGDFLKFTSQYEGLFESVWDRGAYGALPYDLRVKYAANMIRLLGGNLNYILEGYSYDPKLYPGPPHSITIDELGQTYGSGFNVELLDEVAGRAFTEGLDVKIKYYSITPKSD